MGFWKQGMAVAVVGLGLMSGEVHAQSAEDFLLAQQVAEPPAPLARDTSDDFTLQSFNGRSVLPVKVRNCWYFAYTSYLAPGPGHPPFLVAWLTVDRLPVAGCTAQRLQLGYSSSSRFMVAVKQGQLALAWTVDMGPYWFPSLALQLTHVDARTMQFQRTANTRLSVPIGWSPNGWTGGHVIPEQLDFDGQRLVLQGTRDGVLLEGSPESGSGPNFTATYERFLDSDAPASVVAY